MKKLLLVILIVQLSSSTIFAQRNPFFPNQHGTYSPGYENRNLESEPGFFPSGDDFAFLSAFNIQETEIRIDSIYFLREDGYHFIKLNYDEYGNVSSELRQELKSGAWENKWLTTYTYNQNENMITEFRQRWEVDEWKELSIHTSTYDLLGNQLAQLLQYYEFGELFNSSLYTYTYDSFGNRLSLLSQHWRGEEWQNFSSIINTYNELNKLATAHYQDWDDEAWVDRRMYFYTYDSIGNPLLLMSMSWIFTEWLKTWQYVYNVDEDGNLISQLWQDWDNINGVWENNAQATFTHDDNGNWLTEIRQLWIDGAWQNLVYYIRAFDSQNNLTERKYLFWKNNDWHNGTRVLVDFTLGLVNTQVYQWDGNAWQESTYSEWITIFMGGEHIYADGGISMEFYYTDVTGIEEQSFNIGNETFHSYPNPVTDQINIEINPTWQAESCVIELFNQNGQRVKSLATSPNSKSVIVPIDITGLPPGIYVLKISAGNETSAQKVIISN